MSTEPRTGDEGQRYEVSASNPDGSKIVIGWSDTDEGVASLVEGVMLHPSIHTPRVKDRKELPALARSQLDALLRAELIDLFGDTDTQTECYEQIYEDFFDAAYIALHSDPHEQETIDPEYEKRVSAYLDTQWQMWREKLTLVINSKGRNEHGKATTQDSGPTT